jgi:hypothetical protein
MIHFSFIVWDYVITSQGVMVNFLGWTLTYTFLDLLYWIITGLALVGVELNIRHDKRCFMVWSVTNAIFTIQTFLLGGYNLAILYFVYFIQAIRGLRKWTE